MPAKLPPALHNFSVSLQVCQGINLVDKKSIWAFLCAIVSHQAEPSKGVMVRGPIVPSTKHLWPCITSRSC